MFWLDRTAQNADKPTGRDWWTQRERGTVFWIRVITWIALNIGRSFSRFLLYPITLYFFATSKAARGHSRRFLTKALDRPVGLRECFRHYRYFASTILDRVYLLSGKHSCLDIRLYNKDPILKLVEGGSTCMILGSHLGSFDLLRALGASSDLFSIRVGMDDERNPALARILLRLNPDAANVIIPLNRPGSMLRVRDAVEQGHVIGLLGDRTVAGRRFHACDFFGLPARFPTGPARLATILRLPMFAVFAVYKGGNRYDVHFEPLWDGAMDDDDNRNELVVTIVERYAARLEHFARRFPYNWFNFYDFWRAD